MKGSETSNFLFHYGGLTRVISGVKRRTESFVKVLSGFGVYLMRFDFLALRAKEFLKMDRIVASVLKLRRE